MSSPPQKKASTTDGGYKAMHRNLRLPDDIIIDILAWLPIKCLERFRCLSKACYALVSNPHFIDLHLNRYIESNKLNLLVKCDSLFDLHMCDSFFVLHLPLDFESPEKPLKLKFTTLPPSYIVGSCNGLVCLSEDPKSFYLFNPSTRFFIHLPDCPDPPPGPYEDADDHIHYGFGHSSLTGEYKVLRISYLNEDNIDNKEKELVVVDVYTLGKNSWRSKTLYISGYIEYGKKAVLLNGSLHWVNSDLGSDTQIFSFDIGKEEFYTVPLPSKFFHSHYEIRLCVYKGCLCMFNFISPQNVDDNEERVLNMEVWMMEKYGVRESWTKQLAMDVAMGVDENWRPSLILPNGEILLWRPAKLIVYDPKMGICRDISLRNTDGNLVIDSPRSKSSIKNYCNFVAVDYIESLVSVMA